MKRWKAARQLFLDAAQPIADYELRVEQIERLMRDRNLEAPLQLEEPNKRSKYHPEALKQAYQIYKLTGNLIINPFALGADTLILADDDWLSDFLNFQLWVKYLKDYPKRGAMMR